MSTAVRPDLRQRNLDLVNTFQREVVHGGKYHLARDWAHEDLTIHLPPGLVPPGLDNALAWFEECTHWFTSHGIEVKHQLADDTTVLQLIELHFTHTGTYMGIPPTHKRFSVAGLAAFRIRDEKISDHWGLYDLASVPAKLGIEMDQWGQPGQPATQPDDQRSSS